MIEGVCICWAKCDIAKRRLSRWGPCSYEVVFSTIERLVLFVVFEKRNSNGLVEFEGNLIPEDLVKQVLQFRAEHADGLVEKPPIPIVDSKGRAINSDGNPSYVKLIRTGETIPVVMMSKDNTAIEAHIFSAAQSCWRPNPRLWQEYVYEGSLGIDYVYIDDLALNEILELYKA